MHQSGPIKGSFIWFLAKIALVVCSASAQTEILCGRRMAGLKELRETMLSCTLKPSAVDLRGTSKHTKCRQTMREGKAMWPPLTHTTTYCRVTQVHSQGNTHLTGIYSHRDLCTHSHINSIDDSNISSQTQITNICSLFSRQRPCQHLPQLVHSQCLVYSE